MRKAARGPGIIMIYQALSTHKYMAAPRKLSAMSVALCTPSREYAIDRSVVDPATVLSVALTEWNFPSVGQSTIVLCTAEDVLNVLNQVCAVPVIASPVPSSAYHRQSIYSEKRSSPQTRNIITHLSIPRCQPPEATRARQSARTRATSLWLWAQ